MTIPLRVSGGPSEDLRGFASEVELDGWMEEDDRARRQGARLLHVPTFFVLAQV